MTLIHSTDAAPVRPRTLLLPAGVCLLLLLPFLTKPLHVDDPLFVWTAKQIAAHPLDPWGFRVNWTGHGRPMYEEMENPPLACYYLAAVGRAFGWGEVALHAAFLPLAVGTAVGTALLAARFCRRPALAALLLVVCPGFLVSSTTVMCDGPMVTFWVWAIYLWDRASTAATATRAAVLLAATAAVLSAAVLTKYPAVNLVPLLAAHAVLRPANHRRTWPLQAITLLVPIAVLVDYDRLMATTYEHAAVIGAASFSHTTTHQSVNPLTGRIPDAVCYAGGAALPAALVGVLVIGRGHGWTAWARRAAVVAVPAALAGAAAALSAAPAGWAPPHGPSPAGYYAQFGLFAAAGLATIVAVLVGTGWRDRSGWFLLLWVGGVFTFATFLNWSTNIRTLLPMLPAVCILAVRAADSYPLARGWSAVTVAAAAAVSLVVARADDRFARDNRDAVARLAAGGVPLSHAWFGGHWGFQYYMQRAGARPLDDTVHDYRPGDTVVLALDNYGTPAVAGNLQHVGFLAIDPGPWVSTMNLWMGGGFYVSPMVYDLPFVVGPIPPEAYEVDRLTAVR